MSETREKEKGSKAQEDHKHGEEIQFGEDM